MEVIEVEVTQAAEPWPAAGHHLRVMTFTDRHADHGSTLETAVDVGVNRIVVPEGHHVLRLFHTEGTWEERQIGTGTPRRAAFRLPEPAFPFARPDLVGTVRGLDAQRIWRAFLKGDPDDDLRGGADGHSQADGACGTVVVAEHGGVRTAFMAPASHAGARLDARVYRPDGEGGRPRIRMRWEHPVLGMVLPHLAMNQIGSAAPQVDRLISDGTAARLLRDGDVCAALAVAHVMIARRHEEGDPLPLLLETAEELPGVADVHLLLAYEAVIAGNRATATDLALRALDLGPPLLTATASTLHALSMHLEGEPRVTEARRLCALVDPGCLFTSVRLPA